MHIAARVESCGNSACSMARETRPTWKTRPYYGQSKIVRENLLLQMSSRRAKNFVAEPIKCVSTRGVVFKSIDFCLQSEHFFSCFLYVCSLSVLQSIFFYSLSNTAAAKRRTSDSINNTCNIILSSLFLSFSLLCQRYFTAQHLNVI